MANFSNDLDSFWMPFTANRQFKQAPRLLVSADGMYYKSHDGRTILDGTAGLWCCNAGHNRPKIVEAIQKSAATLDFAPTFQMGHPSAFTLANRLAAIAPEGMGQVFFCNSGSEAVDSALKMALAYHRARGDGARTRFIGRERGYHGVGFGGISVGGLVNNRKTFIQLPGTDHLRHTHDPARNAFTKGQPRHGAEFADELERLIALHDASTIAAVIVEPVAGSTGVLVPPAGYLEKLRAICDRTGILLIFDEVITGFGRVGAPFAAHRFNVTPDLITGAKGVTNGTVPMGVVLAKSSLYQTVIEASAETAIEFFHGYTYSAHPLACAAALGTLDTYEEEGLFDRVRSLEAHWEDRLHALRPLPNVIDLRNFGLIGAIELAPRANAPGTRAYDVFTGCYEAGLLTRATGDTIALSPPLIIENDQIDQLFDILEQVLKKTA
jgi:beta-alanine--pyruvate transaminase